MSLPSWEAVLQKAVLQKALKRWNNQRPLRVCVLGIGQELRGDDGVGLAVARQLRPLVSDDFLVIEAGHAPENHTSAVRRFRPGLVLLVDAAHLGEPPGTIRWLSGSEIDGISASTHTLPLTVLAHFLQIELGCAVGLIGIQPGDTTIGAGLSAAVETAAAAVVSWLKQGQG